ncbi:MULTISPECIES: hypothetical protein [Streptomyces]|uniref:Cytochrome C oxidase subunit I n=2 Tax=Streptomyces TaxID=1883 RepID=A0A100Y9X1_9ACTN|nr:MULTISPECIES: hypothetical protein [Streptomyces]KUH40369.1 hypothetical protein ATE80_01875 [Streptomyces kanasensis]UUS29818.1 hypothetical protein NRO40_02525 [Streptomyces changanensis]
MTAHRAARRAGRPLHRTHSREARAEGEAFARRMPWLTAAQHEEVARLYAEDRVESSARLLGRTTARCGELREEYAAHYDRLRRRLLCAGAATLLTAAALCAGTWSALR